jgi:predicted dinucleotide-binding enzyme
MRIGILGSGNMGAALGHLFAAAGHAVTFSYSRDPAKLERLARRNGPRARAGSPSEAARGAQAVLLAVHWSRVPHVLRAVGSLRGKILIDCTLPMTPSDTALAVGHRISGGELIARRARGARVVKAFNTVPAELLRAGAATLPEQPMVCYCGNDPRAKRVVSRLIQEIGFEPVNCGRLAMARYLEPFTLLVAELAYNQHRRPEVGVRFIRPGPQRGAKRR